VTSDGSNPQTSETRYDQNGRVAKTISPEGVVTSHEYDSLGRQTKTVTGDLQTLTEYDSMGRVGRVHVCGDGTTRTKSYLYNAFGNILQTTNPDDTFIRTGYDTRGQKVSETNQLGQTRTFEYDAQGRLVKVIMPACGNETLAQRTFTYAYDAHGNQTSIKDPLNRVTEFEYDLRGNLLTRTLPMNQTETFLYDDFGRQILHVSFEGVYAKSQYDNFGRLFEKKFYTNATSYNNGTGTATDTWTYKYDAFGREMQVNQSQSNQKTKKTYTSSGRLETVTQTIDSANDTVSYDYDDCGRQTQVSGAGQVTEYAYDSQNRLEKVIVGNSETVYEYDAFGNRAKTTLPNGVATTYLYDKMNRLLVAEAKKGVTRISKFEYEYDDLGQKKRAVEEFVGDKTVETTWDSDNHNRVTNESIKHNNAAYQILAWTYDLVGNRLTQVKNGSQTTTYGYDANDRLTSETGATNIQYDGTRLKSKGTAQYTYDVQGRLKTLTDGSTTVNYTYNAGGICTSQTTGGVKSLYVIDPQNMTGYDQVLVEKTGSTVAKSYTIGLERISQYSPSTTHYFLYDGHGNTRTLLNTSGAMVSNQRFDYDAFGNAVGFTPSTALTQYLYCSEAFDTKLGWMYLRARWYDPKVGRFNRLDPFFGNISDPQSLHKYTYCHGDPVNFTDPSGMAYFFAELGKVAHQLINDLYENDHFGHDMTLGKAIRGYYSTILPDIVNYTKGQIGEIKPCSAYGLATGPVQLWAAINIANSLPVAHSRLGGGPWKPEDWNPGIQVLYPGTINPWFSDHLIVTLGNLNGLILYKTLRIPVKVLPVLVIYMLADKIAEIAQDMMKDMRFGFDPILEPIYDLRFEYLLASIAITGAAIWGVTARNQIETVRGNVMMMISSLLTVRPGLCLGM